MNSSPGVENEKLQPGSGKTGTIDHSSTSQIVSFFLLSSVFLNKRPEFA